jgi:phage gp36-like protein
MSAYAGYNDVIRRYQPLLTMIGSAAPDVSTTDIASIYIADAEGLINAYLGAKYVLPLAMPEPLITRIAADIAIYKVIEDRAPRVPEMAANRYTDAQSLLSMLRDGKMVLSNSQTFVADGGDNEAFSSTGSYHPVFSPVLRAEDQAAPSDYIDAERGERTNDHGDFLP